MQNKREIRLTNNQCCSILRDEIVRDSTTNSVFELIVDIEGELIELTDGTYQRDGIAICLEKNSNVKYQFSYTESGDVEHDMSCHCSQHLTEFNEYENT